MRRSLIGNLYKVAREMGKYIFFRSDVHAKILRFFDKVFMIRVAMGAVNFKIVPEASVFRGDADVDGPGAQKYHF